MLSDDVILSTIRTHHLDRAPDGLQRVVSFEMWEGDSRTYKRRLVVSDIHAVWVVDALLKGLEEAQNRIAEVVGALVQVPAQTFSAADQEILDALAAAGPKQDSGAALVGVECWMRENMSMGDCGWVGPEKVADYSDDGDGFPYLTDGSTGNGAYFAHAHPVALGRPE